MKGSGPATFSDLPKVLSLRSNTEFRRTKMSLVLNQASVLERERLAETRKAIFQRFPLSPQLSLMHIFATSQSFHFLISSCAAVFSQNPPKKRSGDPNLGSEKCMYVLGRADDYRTWCFENLAA